MNETEWDKFIGSLPEEAFTAEEALECGWNGGYAAAENKFKEENARLKAEIEKSKTFGRIDFDKGLAQTRENVFGSFERLIAKAEAAEAFKDAGLNLWAVLANASGGDWTRESIEWQKAAAGARDQYFDLCDREAKGDAKP